MGGEIEAGLIGGEAPGGRTAVLVGYGPRTTTAQRRPRRAAPDRGETVAFEEQDGEASSGTRIAVLAKPPVRKMARDLGVDLRKVPPTGPNGTITRADVTAAAAAPSVTPAPATQREERIPVKGLRRMTAAAMVASAFSAPHVTEFLTIDATRTVEFVARLKSHPAMAGLKVSPLLILAKAMCLAVGRTPQINASFDEAAHEIVLKHYVNLGIAAATPRGLLVPNIKDAHTLSLPELAAALAGLTTTARDGRTQPGDLSGGTITITNVGVFGVDAGTPIINPGESAILALGAIRNRPWVVEDQVMVRQVTTLSLSFDHRVLDGEAGSRFLVDVASVLEDPASALLF
jgi:pyruvate dehydrogenase E2 component (dihydrolipoamide acetyltransferase)